jgi:regulator of protease activity HflC (stomatin/prohibitin superfamily)
MEQLTQTTLRNVIGEMDLDETLISREIINDKIKTALDQATGRWGVLVNRVEIKDIRPSDEIIEAMEKQMRAERDKRATILEAEGKKEAAILKAEGTKEAQIHYADGEKRANIMQAEGEAVARIRGAQAEAEALNKIAAIISPDKGDPANYLIAVRYIEALKEMVSGKENKVVYLPYEATGILGAIGGMKDMLVSMKKQKKTDTTNSTAEATSKS